MFRQWLLKVADRRSCLQSADVRVLSGRYAGAALAMLVVACVGMMIVPLPTPVLDLLLSLNIALAVVLLLVALYVGDALKIAAFPSLLLLTTLFRVALEVSATRLILLKANAGQVIHAFGHFVVAGNWVVGVVVFVVLTTIQYVVIANGAARVAEVGARFALDAMPGKQLAIDAELRAGSIDSKEAQRRRAQLARESSFFGAMDGGMKFVKGDALAGLLILLINCVGGLLIGVLDKGMTIASALRTYTLLTIGEGLVAQIPALVISTAAGILVTRVSASDDEGPLGQEIGAQILAQPKALALAAAFLALLALVPGLPAPPFLTLAALLGLFAYRLARTESPRADAPVRAGDVPLVVPVRLRLSPELADELIPPSKSSRFSRDVLPGVRERVFREIGIEVPPITVVKTEQGQPAHAYALDLFELPTASGSVDPDAGPAEETIARHLFEILCRHGHVFVGVQSTQALLDHLERTQPALVREVVPKFIAPIALAEVLRGLAKEGISLRHLADILTALAQAPQRLRHPADLAEHVRASLRRHITFRHQSPDGSVPVYVLDSLIEDTVREAIRETEGERRLALEPDLCRDIVVAVGRTVTDARAPVLVTAADLRRHVRGLLEVEHPDLTVLAYQELAPEAKLRTLGRISIASSD